LSFDLFSGSRTVAENVKAVTFYVMVSTDKGAAGNYWTSLEDWPVFNATKFYLQPSGVLSADFENVNDDSASTSFTYDPTNPVPTVGGNNLAMTCGPLDQRPVEKRADVISFTSSPLTSPLAITGPINVLLYVSSSAVDTDFTAKLTDVYPDGTSQLIQDGAIRMRWREYDVPTLMKPNTTYEVLISLWNSSWVFSPGHSLRVSISSSNYPRFSVNPNNGFPLAQQGPNITALNTVFHSTSYPSAIILPVVSLSQLPAFPVELYRPFFDDPYSVYKYVLPFLRLRSVNLNLDQLDWTQLIHPRTLQTLERERT